MYKIYAKFNEKRLEFLIIAKQNFDDFSLSFLFLTSSLIYTSYFEGKTLHDYVHTHTHIYLTIAIHSKSVRGCGCTAICCRETKVASG